MTMLTARRLPIVLIVSLFTVITSSAPVGYPYAAPMEDLTLKK